MFVLFGGETLAHRVGLVGVLVGFKATGFLSAIGVGHMIAVASSTSFFT